MRFVAKVVLYGATALLAIAFPPLVLLLAILWGLTALARTSGPPRVVERPVPRRPEPKPPEPVLSRAEALARRFG